MHPNASGGCGTFPASAPIPAAPSDGWAGQLPSGAGTPRLPLPGDPSAGEGEGSAGIHRDPQAPPAPRSRRVPTVCSRLDMVLRRRDRRAGAIRAAAHVARPWACPSRPAPAPATASSGPAPGGTGQGAPGRGARAAPPEGAGRAGTARRDRAARRKVPSNEALGALLPRPGSRRTAPLTRLRGGKAPPEDDDGRKIDV